MIRTIIAAAIALPVLATTASAEDARMSNSEFIRAARCLAHANLTILASDRPDITALTERVNHELTVKNDETKKRAQAESRRVYMNAVQADTPGEIDKMRARRDRLCSGLVTASAAPAPQG